SADGRFVVFDSFGPFVVEDTNGVRDVYLHDVATGMTARVSEGYAGEADGSSAFGALSADGRSVAFESSAANLVPDDANAVGDVFVAPNPFLE
ncbi:MAG: hypothetical protein KC466_17850, partial [Myxococcales bacterium]|nr:hypothetical protein [Myxococcales bacterium]